MVFQYDYNVPFTACDEHGLLPAAGCIDIFQDAANQHTDAVVPAEVRANNRTWILNYWHLIFDQPLHYNDTLRISTWSAGAERMFAHRYYKVDAPSGETAVRALSLWFLVDLKRMRPVRIKDDDLKWYESEPALDMGDDDRRIALPEEMEQREPVKVSRYMIDGYGHVNNAWYIRVAAEYLPEGCTIKELRASYPAQAQYGDSFYPAVAQVDNRFYVALNNAEGKPHAIVEAIF